VGCRCPIGACRPTVPSVVDGERTPGDVPWDGVPCAKAPPAANVAIATAIGNERIAVLLVLEQRVVI